MVGRELKRDKRLDLFAPTPPLETLKLLVAKCAKSQGTPKPKRNGIFDVSRAYFYAPCQRPIFIEIPDEDWEVGDEHRVGRLKLSLYGTRDAAQNWAAAYTKYLLSLGFEQGRASRCNFQHKSRDIRLTVHGDDFLVVAGAEQLAWLDVKLRQQYDMKSEVLGPEANMKQKVRILNRTLRWAKKGIEYEADDRHAIKIMQECAVINVRASKKPGTPGHADDNCANSVGSSLTDQEK